MVICLQHHDACALAHDETVAVDIIRTWSALRLVVEIGGKRTRLSESGNAERADCTFGATGQHNVSIIHCAHAGRIANAVRARRTGPDNGVVRAPPAIFHTDLPQNQVDETTMTKTWENDARSSKRTV